MGDKQIRAARVVRWGILAASAAFFLFFANVISEHAICPIGGFEIFFANLFHSGFSVAGLFSGMVVIFLVMSVVSIVFRRAYCGYICPLGALQELISRVGRFVLPKKMKGLRLPRKADRLLKWAKYLTLGAFLVGATLTTAHWMLPGDPFIAMMSLFSRGGLASIWQRLPFAVLFLFAILAFSFFFGRGFCAYLCPAGAWYAILSKASPSKIRRDAHSCVGCGKCTKACPMGIDVAAKKSVNDADCIGCRECVAACPVSGALAMKTGPIAVPPAVIPFAAAAAFAGTVFFAVKAMPARDGNHGRGGDGNGGYRGGSGQDAGTPQAIQGASGASTSGARVSIGGCASCVACGLCLSQAERA